MEHKKALYYDGHDRVDVLAYCQNVFLPAMANYQYRLVEYVVGDVDTELSKARNYVERGLVLVAHDESTNQAARSQGGFLMVNSH